MWFDEDFMKSDFSKSEVSIGFKSGFLRRPRPCGRTSAGPLHHDRRHQDGDAVKPVIIVPQTSNRE